MADPHVALDLALHDAFEAGRADGRREIFSAVSGCVDAAPPRRAAPGSVRPVILAFLAARSGTTEEIARVTGLKFNTVRGTLWAMEQEGSVVKQNKRYVAQ